MSLKRRCSSFNGVQIGFFISIHPVIEINIPAIINRMPVYIGPGHPLAMEYIVVPKPIKVSNAPENTTMAPHISFLGISFIPSQFSNCMNIGEAR